ncbi:MAG: UPF0280 family protein [Proteobacteria bacterium]|nr:UPF0280 family protein [Pseudomonadota bacterium]
MPYQERTYRKSVRTEGLVTFTVVVKETDVFISASRNLAHEAKIAVLEARFKIEEYIQKHPDFLWRLTPLPVDDFAPEVVKNMLRASSRAGVGPMAAVAGAVAEFTGIELLKHCDEVMVENGGDIFFKVNRDITVSIFAGASPLSGRIGIKLGPTPAPFGICTSSRTVGPSLSLGNADAVTVISSSAALADAAATAIGNLVKNDSDIQYAIDNGQKISGVDGMLIIKGNQLGVWGNINLISL